jgi:hypothetical protein
MGREQPQPGPADVLIRIEATTVGNNDLDAIFGRWASLPVPAPFVPAKRSWGWWWTRAQKCSPGLAMPEFQHATRNTWIL